MSSKARNFKSPESRAKALANLRPFEKGKAHPRHTTAGESIKEWINRMAQWKTSQIRTAFKDKNITHAQRKACERMLSTDGADFDRIMDRTIGKPVQETKMEVDTTAQVVVQHTHALAIDESADRSALILALIQRRNKALNGEASDKDAPAKLE